MIFLFFGLAFSSADAAVNDMRSSVHWPANGDKVTKTHYEFVDMPTDVVKRSKRSKNECK